MLVNVARAGTNEASRFVEIFCPSHTHTHVSVNPMHVSVRQTTKKRNLFSFSLRLARDPALNILMCEYVIN